MILNDSNTKQNIDSYDIFATSTGDSNTNSSIINDDIYVNKNIELNNNKNNNTQQNITEQDYNTQTVEIKVQEYEDKNPNFLLQLKDIIGKRKYNKLSFNEKYLIFRYFLEDIDNKIKNLLLSQNNKKKKAFIKSLLKYYQQNITYLGNNLNELDYYYIAPFIFFFNAKILDPTNTNHYTNSMIEMINNRINKKKIRWNDTIEFNDLENIREKVIFYKTNYPDVYENIKSLFTTEDIKIMPLTQKCALLRIFIDGILKDKYQNAKSKDLQKKLITDANKIYQKISKLTNFSYYWFIFIYHKFEDYVIIDSLIKEYEKQNQQKIIQLINYLGNERYNKLSLIKKYTLLKVFLSDTCQNLFKAFDYEELNNEFTLTIVNDVDRYFEDTFSLADTDEVIEALLRIYNNILLDANKEKQKILEEEKIKEQEQQAQNQQQIMQQQMIQQQPQQQVQQQPIQQNQDIMQALMQQQIMQQQMIQQQLQQQPMQQNQPQQSVQQTTQQEIEQQALKQMLIQQQIQQHVQQPQQQTQDIMQALMQQQIMQQQTQQTAQTQNNEKIDFKLAYPTRNDEIIYFAGYKDDKQEELSLYKMTMAKFQGNQEQFIKNYRILTYKNEDGNMVPILITEKYYNEKCNGSKKTCLSMIKETLNELKLSNVPEKISAFKGIATKK